MRLFEAVGSHRLKLGEASGGSEQGLCARDGFAASVLMYLHLDVFTLCQGEGNRQGSAAA